MAFRASVQVLLSCSFGQAARLLAAAEKGSSNEVSEILCSKPQLAAYTGFNNSYSPLHRAAAAGHMEVCRSIIEPIKQRIKVAEAAVVAGRKRNGALKKWQGLLATVLNQRTSRSMTPLMLACENGHATVAAYLLREGADPLACDWVHMRTCLHYAAMAGQADCLRLLCSANTQVQAKDGFRALRDVVVQDIQVETCRFIDQRAFGGLTALHFAVVTGNLESVQALLRGGASIMVKTDGEAYIGDEYLVPGSTPLHIAVIIGNISIVHAILQAHMENMNVVGQGLDERGRRPWEGSSRTDIRSVRNTFRKLAFHLARERGLQQLMSLVDPRIPIDVALDAARDTEHGIGPKRLSTIVSLVLQQSLLHWLDRCQVEIEREHSAGGAAAAHAQLASILAAQRRASEAGASPAGRAGSRPASAGPSPPQPGRQGRPPLPPPGQQSGGSRRQSTDSQHSLPGPLSLPPQSAPISSSRVSADKAAAQQPGTEGLGSPKTPDGEAQAAGGAPGLIAAAVAAASQQQAEQPAAAMAEPEVGEWPEAAGISSPFAIDPSCPYITQSAPVTPAQPPAMDVGPESAPAQLPLAASLPGVLLLEPQEEASATSPATAGAGEEDEGTSPSTALQRMNSLHGYMGMLSVKRTRTRSVDVTSGRGLEPQQRMRGAVTSRSAAPPARLGGTEGQSPASRRLVRQPSAPAAAMLAAGQPGGDSNSFVAVTGMPLSARGRAATDSAEAGDRTVTVLSRRRSSAQANAPTMRGLLTSIRDRLRSTDAIPAAPSLSEEGKDKDLLEVEPSSPAKSEGTEGDVECGVCLDHAVEVAFAGCEHALCLECARNLTKQDKKPPHCPFCRRLVVGFVRVSPMLHHRLSRS